MCVKTFNVIMNCFFISVLFGFFNKQTYNYFSPHVKPISEEEFQTFKKFYDEKKLSMF